MTENSENESEVRDEDHPEMSCLSVAEAREMLAKKYNVPLEEDDPVFMTVTLHEAFMKDLMRMLEQHTEALGHVLEHEISGMQDKLEKAVGEFAGKIRELSTDNVSALVKEHQKIAVEHYQATRQLTYVNMALTVIVAALAGMILWQWRMG